MLLTMLITNFGIFLHVMAQIRPQFGLKLSLSGCSDLTGRPPSQISFSMTEIKSNQNQKYTFKQIKIFLRKINTFIEIEILYVDIKIIIKNNNILYCDENIVNTRVYRFLAKSHEIYSFTQQIMRMTLTFILVPLSTKSMHYQQEFNFMKFVIFYQKNNCQ